jgi:hypothetical protein
MYYYSKYINISNKIFSFLILIYNFIYITKLEIGMKNISSYILKKYMKIKVSPSGRSIRPISLIFFLNESI